MVNSPIVIGVDESQESVHAAAVGVELAADLGAKAMLVTVVPDPWAAAPVSEVPFDVTAFNRDNEEAQRREVQAALRGSVPDELVDDLVTEIGRPQQLLAAVAERVGAGLLVLGGKHHSRVARWLSGSTAHHVLRKLEVPVLVVRPDTERVRRVLCAVDLSSAARPTITHAEELAGATGAEIRVLHVVSPVPVTAPLPMPFDTDYLRQQAEKRLEAEVWPVITHPQAERVVQVGQVAETIIQEARRWSADVVVLGSHGKGFVDRVLLGSATEQLLNELPASLLVVPTGAN
jgi:nucleotide-binding universal stress UspA family protein